MYDIFWIKDHPNLFKEGWIARGGKKEEADDLFSHLSALDDQRRTLIAQRQKLQEERNRLSKEIGQALAQKAPVQAERLKKRVAEIKEEEGGLAHRERQVIHALDQKLSELPQCPLPDVPRGTNERDNRIIRVEGKAPSFDSDFKPKEHFEEAEASGLMDFETAARLSGSRFVVLKGALARLERALGQFMLDLHTEEHGYTEILPPLLVRENAMFGTAQLPKFERDQFWALSGEIFKGENGDESEASASFVSQARAQRWGLIPTAEVPLTNLVRERILEERDLPLRFTALTPCFRSEAGAAGRDTRGMIRHHQFTKVELVSITRAQESAAEHERMLTCAENVLKRLGLHYRVALLCSGDMGFASQKTYDLEVWMAGQGRFREISSCSSCGDFQARRMQARYRPIQEKEKGLPFVHTLNGSGVAVGRALAALLETYQQRDGSVIIPSVLHPYMKGLERIMVRS